MWKPLIDGVRTIAALLLAMIGLCLFFGLAMLPQFGFMWFIDQGGTQMLLPAIALVILGRLFRKLRNYRISISVICLIVLAMAMLRGFYWHPFEAGDALFSPNRVTGFVFLLLSMVSTEIYDRLANRFGWSIF